MDPARLGWLGILLATRLCRRGLAGAEYGGRHGLSWHSMTCRALRKVEGGRPGERGESRDGGAGLRMSPTHLAGARARLW